MFGSLTEKLQNLFSGLSGKKSLTDENIADAVREVRLALLDADVNYTVVSQFIKRVKEKAVGDAVLKSVSPGQQFIHLVHEELISLMGSEEALLDLNGKLSVLMVCGLQGSGKTTSCAKLAAFIGKAENHKKILLAACDLQRPAAVDQLKTLGSQIGVTVFSIVGERDPLKVAKKAYEKAQAEEYDVLIVDTAGRLHLDEELMKEL
jgi:signal recognition particle subunit SRP54